MKFQRPSRALTIAGFDPSGGAGVLADAKTFAAFGLQTSAAITSVTFQNSKYFAGAIHQTRKALRAQVEPMLAEFRIVCTKTGMLPTRALVLEAARLFRETDLPRPVIDPALVSSSGRRLMEVDAVVVLIKELIPMAQLVTPNIPEAEALTGMAIASVADMQRAAVAIRQLGAAAVLIKGGHLKEQAIDGRRQMAGQAADESELDDLAIDVLDNDGTVTLFPERRIPGAQLHGSGCVLSAAIAAGLGNGMTLEDSVGKAKGFVWEAIRHSPRVQAD